MLLTLMQSLGMGGGEAFVQVAAGGGGDDVQAPPKKRKRGDRDHRWLRDPIWETWALQQQVLGSEEERKEALADALDAGETISSAVSDFGGLLIVPPPPKAVTQRVLELSPLPDFGLVLDAIQEARLLEQNRSQKALIAAYEEKIRTMRKRARMAANRDRNRKIIEQMLAQGLI